MKTHQVLLLVFAASVFSDIVSATNSKRCTKICGFAAFCKNNECVCRAKREGDPNIACYLPKFYYYCQIAFDPMLSAFDKQEAGIKMPAAIGLTSLTTRRFGNGKGKCSFSLGGWTQRFEGKYFIKALQFEFKQTKTVGAAIEAKFQVIGKVINNQYFYTINQKTNAGWVKIAEINPTTKRPVVKQVVGCVVRFFRLRSKFLYVNIVCCTLRFSIRAHNPAKPELIPGVWVMVRKFAQMNTLPNGLCNNGTNSPNLDTLKDMYGFNSRTQLTTYASLAYGFPVSYPGAFPGLLALQNMLKACNPNRRSAFMTKAEFLFNYEKLIICEGNKMMGITYNVAKGYCMNNAAACSAAINTIKTDCPNLKSNKQMNAFLENGCV